VRHKPALLARLASPRAFVTLMNGPTLPVEAIEVALEFERRGFRMTLDAAEQFAIESTRASGLLTGARSYFTLATAPERDSGVPGVKAGVAPMRPGERPSWGHVNAILNGTNHPDATKISFNQFVRRDASQDNVHAHGR